MSCPMMRHSVAHASVCLALVQHRRDFFSICNLQKCIENVYSAKRLVQKQNRILFVLEERISKPMRSSRTNTIITCAAVAAALLLHPPLATSFPLLFWYLETPFRSRRRAVLLAAALCALIAASARLGNTLGWVDRFVRHARHVHVQHMSFLNHVDGPASPASPDPALDPFHIHKTTWLAMAAPSCFLLGCIAFYAVLYRDLKTLGRYKRFEMEEVVLVMLAGDGVLWLLLSIWIPSSSSSSSTPPVSRSVALETFSIVTFFLTTALLLLLSCVTLGWTVLSCFFSHVSRITLFENVLHTLHTFSETVADTATSSVSAFFLEMSWCDGGTVPETAWSWCSDPGVGAGAGVERSAQVVRAMWDGAGTSAYTRIGWFGLQMIGYVLCILTVHTCCTTVQQRQRVHEAKQMYQ